MKNNKWIGGTMMVAIALSASPNVDAGELLADDELAVITAGTAEDAYSDGRVAIDLEKVTGRGTRIGALGELTVVVNPTDINTAVLHLEDNAQGNLRALVSTNAVNSPVQVLINLNVNVNSRVDVLNQVNSALQQR